MPVSLGIGGFSMGAAAALHSAACYAHGRFTNGVAYPINLRVVVGLSGWLPSSRYGIIIIRKRERKKPKYAWLC
jgi:S-formylglutathione hydrolase FrmB